MNFNSNVAEKRTSFNLEIQKGQVINEFTRLVSFLITDNGANITKAVNDYGKDYSHATFVVKNAG